MGGGGRGGRIIGKRGEGKVKKLLSISNLSSLQFEEFENGLGAAFILFQSVFVVLVGASLFHSLSAVVIRDVGKQILKNKINLAYL